MEDQEFALISAFPSAGEISRPVMIDWRLVVAYLTIAVVALLAI